MNYSDFLSVSFILSCVICATVQQVFCCVFVFHINVGTTGGTMVCALGSVLALYDIIGQKVTNGVARYTAYTYRASR